MGRWTVTFEIDAQIQDGDPMAMEARRKHSLRTNCGRGALHLLDHLRAPERFLRGASLGAVHDDDPPSRPLRVLLALAVPFP